MKPLQSQGGSMTYEDDPNFSGAVRHVCVEDEPNIDFRPIPGGQVVRLSMALPKERRRAMIEETSGAVLEIELREENTLALIDGLQRVAREMRWLPALPEGPTFQKQVGEPRTGREPPNR
jgi:hypothetical protein